MYLHSGKSLEKLSLLGKQQKNYLKVQKTAETEEASRTAPSPLTNYFIWYHEFLMTHTHTHTLQTNSMGLH